MSIQLYTSRQSAGENPAREKVIDEIIRLYKSLGFKERSKIFVITPSQNTFQVERELIQKVGEGGLLGLRVIDFEELLQSVVEEGNAALEVVDEHGRLMLMQKTLTDISDQLTVYRSSVNKRGFAEEVVRQISELKSFDLTPESLLERSNELEGSLLSEKIKDLSTIFRAFNQNLGQGRVDEDDLKVYAFSLLPISEKFRDSYLFFLDFNELDTGMSEFILRLSEIAASIQVALIADQTPMIADATAFSAANNSIESLFRLAKQTRTDLTSNYLTLSHAGTLGHLANRLFSYQPDFYPGEVNNIALYSMREPWDEIVRIAQMVALEIDKGRSPSRIAVATSDLGIYGGYIKRIFTEYAIPVFIDENHAVIDNHFVQWIISALDSVDSGLRENDLLSYLKSEFSSLSPDEADLIENYVIEAGIKPWEWKKSFTRIPPNWRKNEAYKDKKRLDKDNEINKIRESVYKTLTLLKPEKKELTFDEHIKNLTNFLEATNAEKLLVELSDKIAQNESQEIALRYRQIWNILMQVLSQMSETLGKDYVSFSDFVEVLKTGLSSYEIGTIPEDKEAVLIASLERTRLPEIDSLYFVGLNEGLLPKVVYEEGLLSEFDKERIGGKFENNKSWGREYEHRLEELNFYALLTKAQKRLTFSYSNFDSEGSVLTPSRYVDTLKTLFGEKILKAHPKVFNLLNPKRAEVIIESLDPEEKITWATKRIVKDWFKENPKYKDLLGISYLSETHTSRGEDKLFNHDVNELYSQNKNTILVSPSRLEMFAQCPYKHFLQYGLRPANREAYEVKSLHTGIVVHEVFNRFLSRIRDEANGDGKLYLTLVESYLNNREAFEMDFEKVFDEVFVELEDSKRYEHSAASRYLVKKIRRIVTTALLIMLEQIQKSHFIPVLLEEPFLEDRGDIKIEGRIDRIDLPLESMSLLNEGEKISMPLRVIDYKTGNKRIEFTDLLYGRSLQLALYLDEAIKAYRKRFNCQTRPSGAYYFLADNARLSNTFTDNVLDAVYSEYRLDGMYEAGTEGEDIKKTNARGKIKQPKDLSADEFEKIINHTNTLIDDFSNQILGGNISIAPMRINNEDIGCQYCAFVDICRYNAENEDWRELKKREKREVDRETFFKALEESGGEDE